MTTIIKLSLNGAGLHGLRIKVEKLNKRARRHGLEEIRVDVLSEELVTREHNGIEVTELRYEVEINGCEPCINGWRLIARIEFNDTIGNVVRIVPWYEDNGTFAKYRTIDPTCEHCNTARRRNDVFVLQHESEGRKVVGRNCLADFLRCGDAESLAQYGEWCEQLARLTPTECEEEGFEGGWGNQFKPVQPLDEYLALVAMMTRRIGWVSRTEARDSMATATVDQVGYYLYGRRDHYWREFIQENDLYVNEGDHTLADKAIEWAQGIEETNEYLSILHRIAVEGIVDWSLDGYTGSMIVAYHKAQDREREKAQAPTKVWLGAVKERVKDQVVTVLRVRYTDGEWGTRTIVAMEAPVGDSVAPLVWFATGSQEYDEGAQYRLTATIKAHDNREGWGKQTIVTRAKLIPC